VAYGAGLPDEPDVWTAWIDETERETADAGCAAVGIEKSIH
jgi:hypothetical protein